jgi:hypothetical protein
VSYRKKIKVKKPLKFYWHTYTYMAIPQVSLSSGNKCKTEFAWKLIIARTHDKDMCKSYWQTSHFCFSSTTRLCNQYTNLWNQSAHEQTMLHQLLRWSKANKTAVKYTEHVWGQLSLVWSRVCSTHLRMFRHNGTLRRPHNEQIVLNDYYLQCKQCVQNTCLEHQDGHDYSLLVYDGV